MMMIPSITLQLLRMGPADLRTEEPSAVIGIAVVAVVRQASVAADHATVVMDVSQARV